MDWDWIISAGIIVGIILYIWAKVSHQTVPELIRDLKEVITGSGEEVTQNAMEVYA